MRQLPLHRHHLKRMGIDVWVLRRSLSSCYAYELLRRGERVGLLFAVAQQADPHIAALLNKIIQALKCEGKGQWYPQQPDYSTLSGLRVVIGLGENLQLSHFSVPVIKSHSPHYLTTHPPLKAETWAALQAAFPLIENRINPLQQSDATV